MATRKGFPAAAPSARVKPLPLAESPAGAACCAPIRFESIATDAAVTLARQFAALADPVRLQLLSLLATSGTVCACDLVEPVGKSQPTVSHHLKVLREAGLVSAERRGVNIWYAAVPSALEMLRDALGARPRRTTKVAAN
jgi:ArsR family transcriptional regulator, arsenate/arsenite/antimonite-responsive transcriptional repressor